MIVFLSGSWSRHARRDLGAAHSVWRDPGRGSATLAGANGSGLMKRDMTGIRCLRATLPAAVLTLRGPCAAGAVHLRDVVVDGAVTDTEGRGRGRRLAADLSVFL